MTTELSEPEQLGARYTCYRCGGTATEYLEFRSKTKNTRVDLCMDDFVAMRTLMWNFLREIKNSDTATSGSAEEVRPADPAN